jgi:hypothetical protein
MSEDKIEEYIVKPSIEDDDQGIIAAAMIGANYNVE